VTLDNFLAGWLRCYDDAIVWRKSAFGNAPAEFEEFVGLNYGFPRGSCPLRVAGQPQVQLFATLSSLALILYTDTIRMANDVLRGLSDALWALNLICTIHVAISGDGAGEIEKRFEVKE